MNGWLFTTRKGFFGAILSSDKGDRQNAGNG